MLQFVPISDAMLEDPKLLSVALVPYSVGRPCHHAEEDGDEPVASEVRTRYRKNRVRATQSSTRD